MPGAPVYAARAGSPFSRRRPRAARQGNVKRAAAAAVAEPKITNIPKRCVGGKFDRRKMPKPQQITSNEVPIGCQRWEHAFDHALQSRVRFSRRANMVR